MTHSVDIAIIGAGPYGLSIAAHLRHPRRSMRVFGSPMSSWREQMPRGMMLKSDGFASNLSAPGLGFTLADHCVEHGLPYRDVGWPVPLAAFVDYGTEFQRRLVPELEDTTIESLVSGSAGFVLRTALGEELLARRVIVAAGLSHFAHRPGLLGDAAGGRVSHSSQHVEPARFRGQRVAVVGAGASALELAALLHESGSSVTLLSRRSVLDFHQPPNEPRSWLQRLHKPQSGLGPGWRSTLCTGAAPLFHALPQSLRLHIVGRHLGPAAGWFVRDRVIGRLPLHLGMAIEQVRVHGDEAHVAFTTAGGAHQTLVVDHVIAATGYRPAVARLRFVDVRLRAQLRRVNDTPVLDPRFESSVPGLHFVGPMAANSFGPLLRFAYGAAFTAQRLARHITV